MSTVPVYRDVLLSLEAARKGSPLWAAFYNIAYRPNQAFFDGLAETYGPDLFGPAGLQGAVSALAPALHRALQPSPSYRMEDRVERITGRIRPLLGGRLPSIYLGTLFFVAPAATLSIAGRPAIALGLERFSPAPPAGEPKYWYHPGEIEEILPHEAAHAVRMEALGLPPTPLRLSLLDMVMLEGTALLFTDLLLGKESLATFMPSEQLAWHKANDGAITAAAMQDLPATGMPIFTHYFGAHAPISGYWIGYSFCKRYIERFGQGAMGELLCLPSLEILRRIA